MNGFHKKLVSFLLVGVVVAAFAPMPSRAASSVEDDPAFLNYLLENVFDVQDKEGHLSNVQGLFDYQHLPRHRWYPATTVRINDKKFDLECKNGFDFTSNSQSASHDPTKFAAFINSMRSVKNTQDTLHFLNKEIKFGRFLIKAIGPKYLEPLRTPLGFVSIGLVSLKLLYASENNSDRAQILWDESGNLFSGGMFLLSLGFKGNPFFFTVTCLSYLRKNLIEMLHGDHDGPLEQAYDNFSKTYVTYIINEDRFNLKPIKHKTIKLFSDNLRLRNADAKYINTYFTEIDQRELVTSLRARSLRDDEVTPYTFGWNPPFEVYLDWNNLEVWDRILKNIMDKNKENPKQLKESIDKFINDYATIFWRLSEDARIIYSAEYFAPYAIKPYADVYGMTKTTYTNKFKERTVALLQSLFKKYFDEDVAALKSSTLPWLNALKDKLNETITFKIEVFDQELATQKAAHPYKPLYASKYANYRIVYDAPNSEAKFKFDSHDPDFPWIDGDDMKCTYLSYLVYGAPTVAKLYAKPDDKEPELVADVIFAIPTSTIRIKKEETFSGKYSMTWSAPDGSGVMYDGAKDFTEIVTVVDDGRTLTEMSFHDIVTHHFDRATGVYTADLAKSLPDFTYTAKIRLQFTISGTNITASGQISLHTKYINEHRWVNNITMRKISD